MVKVTRNKTQVVQYLREKQRNVRGPEESRRIRPVQPFVGCPGSALGIPRKWRNLLGRSGTSWRSSGFLPNEGSQKAPSPRSADRHRPQAVRCRSPPVSVCGLFSTSFVHQLSASSLSRFSSMVSASSDCDIFTENILCFGPNFVSEKELRTLNIRVFTFQTLLLTRLSVIY